MRTFRRLTPLAATLLLAGPIVLLAPGLAGAAPAGGAAAAASSRGPAVAVEDTLHTEVPEVLVTAPRVTMDEILDRVARSEARRDSAMHDRTFLVTIRVVGRADDRGQGQLLEELVQRVYFRRPDRRRVVQLRNWHRKQAGKKKNDETVQVELGPDMGEEIVNFAFQPAARRQYRYRIDGRQILGDHLIYRLAFEPRSPLEVYEPSGVVWVDTRDYVIVRQEIQFRQSPVPLFVRGIRRMVVERAPVGDTWVLSRVLVRVDTTIPIPRYGRSFDIGISLTEHAINTGLPDSLFTAAPASHARPGGAR